jgi:hypothetical protein
VHNGGVRYGANIGRGYVLRLAGVHGVYNKGRDCKGSQQGKGSKVDNRMHRGSI